MRWLTRTHRRSCRTKAKHDTQVEALEALIATRDAENLMPYRCRCCGGWNLGHKLGTKRAAE